MPIAYSTDVLSSVMPDPLTNVLGEVINFVLDIGVEELSNVNAKMFSAVTTALEFAVSTSPARLGC